MSSNLFFLNVVPTVSIVKMAHCVIDTLMLVMSKKSTLCYHFQTVGLKECVRFNNKLTPFEDKKDF